MTDQEGDQPSRLPRTPEPLTPALTLDTMKKLS